MTTTNEGVTAVIDTSVGKMTVEFLSDKAPGHVQNFLELADKGFYNGTVFHRTIPGFMIQGGCPDGTGMGGPGYNIDAEFNDTPHVKGVLSMARSQDPNSAGSQFFICHGDANFLDNQYTAFGRLLEGEDTLDAIASAPTKPGGEGSAPVEPIQVSSVSVVRSACREANTPSGRRGPRSFLNSPRIVTPSSPASLQCLSSAAGSSAAVSPFLSRFTVVIIVQDTAAKSARPPWRTKPRAPRRRRASDRRAGSDAAATRF